MSAEIYSAAPSARYRIREADVEVCNGYRSYREHRFIAERRCSLFGLMAVWMPFAGSEWRRTEAEAINDIRRDVQMRRPLEPNKFLNAEGDEITPQSEAGS